MVKYRSEAGEREQRILAQIALSTPKSVKKRKIAVAVSAIFCAAYAVLAAYNFSLGYTQNGIWQLAISVIFLALALSAKILQRRLVLWVMKKSAKSAVGGEVEYVIDDDGVEITSSLGTGKNNWSAFNRCGEQDGYIYLIRLDNKAVLIDKSRLTQEELKELERLLENVKKSPEK